MIAVDAMGGDFAPHSIVQGSYRAALKGISVALYGQENLIIHALNQLDTNWAQLPIKVVDCSEIIGMAEEPTRGIIKKKDSSLVCALQAVKDKKAKAVVSAGNSGAALVGGMLYLGKLDGISRPAIGAFLPTKNGSTFVIDLGANTDCKPEFLKQFAFMGAAFVTLVKNIAVPRVGLLSNGTEQYKGSMAVKQAYGLLEQSGLNFIGNIEARDLFNDYADVIVCDGFVGNVTLKTIQGTANFINELMGREFRSSLFTKILGFISQPIFKRLKKNIDYNRQGGALLLGVNAPLIIAHGCSDAYAIENAISFADTAVNNRLIERFNNFYKTFMQQDNQKTNLATFELEKEVSLG